LASLIYSEVLSIGLSSDVIVKSALQVMTIVMELAMYELSSSEVVLRKKNLGFSIVMSILTIRVCM
jgi:hypothetical protein